MNNPSTHRSRLFRAVLPAVIWAALIFVASSIPSEDIPASPILDYDKLIHMAIYFVFAALMYRALRFGGISPALRTRAAILTIGIITLYGATDEFHQHFVPGRTMDVFDWVADVAGGILCVVVLSFLSRWNRRKDASPES
jgi:VanZ family protein